MMAGETVDNIEGLDIVTYRGTRMTVGVTNVAQVLQMAIKEGPMGPSGSLPGTKYTTLERTPTVPAGIIVAGALLADAGIWRGIHRSKV